MLYIFLLITLMIHALEATNSDFVHFQQACSELEQQHWQQAIDEYQKIQSKNADVFYNMAHAHQKLADYPQALLDCKRALLVASYWQIGEILALENQLCAQIGLPVRGYVQTLAVQSLLMIPTMGLQFGLLVLLIILLLLLLHCWQWQELRWRDRYKLQRILVGIIVIGMLLNLQDRVLQKNKALVVKSNAFVYAGPEQTFHVIAKLQPAMCLQVQLPMQQGMYHVKSDMINGWVEQDSIEFIKNDK